MSKVEIRPASYQVGPQHWRRVEGQWQVQMWGWWPNGSSPRWSWETVADARVPQELKDRWRKDNPNA